MVEGIRLSLCHYFQRPIESVQQICQAYDQDAPEMRDGFNDEDKDVYDNSLPPLPPEAQKSKVNFGS